MLAILHSLGMFLVDLFKPRRRLEAENLFLRHQLSIALRRFKGNGWLSNTIGNPLDTTIALQHLIFEGTLDRFPGLKIIAAHGGGYLGSYAARGDHACFVAPQNCNPDIKLKKQPRGYLNQLSLLKTPSI